MRRYEELVDAIEKIEQNFNQTSLRMEGKIDNMSKELGEVKVDLATHKVKTGIWGAFMGAIMAYLGHLFK